MGRIVGVHGLSGAVKVYSYAESPDRFASGCGVTIMDAAEQPHHHQVVWSQPYKNIVRMALEGVSTREQAEALVGCGVFVTKTDLPPLEEGTHYWADVLGMEVRTIDGDYLGQVREIIPTGANDVYVVRPQAESEAGEILIPAIASVVIDLNVQNRRMVVELPEGLV